MSKYTVIFDMDGTLIDNLEYHHHSFRDFAKKYDKNLTNEFLKEINGYGNNTIMRKLFGDLDDVQIKAYADEKERMYRDYYAPYIKPVNGLFELIENLLKSNIYNLGIGSSAPSQNVDFVLDKLNIRKYFQAIISESDVTETKPSPEIFLTVAERLNTLPQHCIVIEDSINGIIAARRASMKVIGITTYHSPEELNDADYLIADYTELSHSKIKELLER